jgi:hypothetical protein
MSNSWRFFEFDPDLAGDPFAELDPQELKRL